MTEETRQTILIVSAPQHENLCCITCFINPKEKHDPSAKSNYHWQILKCRQLIFSHKEIIASPVLGSEIEINIVLTKEFNETGKIQKQLKDLILHENYPTQLTNAIYESCLRYTILAHMAPQWNQVDNCLIQGRDFLEATTARNAIRFDVEVKDMTTFIVLWPLKARLQQLHLEDLDIPPTLTQNFLTQPTASLSTGSLWVHVIPSMKRGRIVSISRQIPNSCPYKTYKEIKRHWKNSYGYRLPESEEGMIYYTMSFHPSIPTKYTYPSICVRPRRTQFLGRVDSEAVVKVFLTDLARKMPNVCGHPFSVDRQYCYERLKSEAASQLNGHIPIDAVFAKASSSLSRMNRSEQDVNIFATQHSNDVSLAPPSLATNHQEFSQQINLATQKSSFESSAIRQDTQKPVSTQASSVFVKSFQLSAIRQDIQKPVSTQASSVGWQGAQLATQHSNGARLAPSSLATKHQDLSQCISLATQKPGLQSRGMDRGSQQSVYNTHFSTVGQQRAQLATERSNLNDNPTCRWDQSQATGIQIPSMNPSSLAFTPPASLAPEHCSPAHGVISPPAVVPCDVPSKSVQPEAAARKKFVPLFAPVPASSTPSPPAPSVAVVAGKKYAPVFGFSTTTQVAQVRDQIPHPDNSRHLQVASVPQKPIFGGITGKPKITPSFNAGQEKKVGDGKTKVMTSKPKIAPSFNTSQEKIGSGRKSALNDIARKRDVTSYPQVAAEELCARKKARPKPQVKTGVDVAQLAHARSLAKVNAVTLITWLRDRAVPCTTRDSKTDLVAKVNKYLNIQ